MCGKELVCMWRSLRCISDVVAYKCLCACVSVGVALLNVGVGVYVFGGGGVSECVYRFHVCL